MVTPKTYRSFLKLLIKIAEHGNDYGGDKKLSREDVLNVGSLIAGIQNDLGEMRETLDKLKLKYNSLSS